MIRQKWVIKLIEEVSKEKNLPYYVVEEVFISQFKLLRDTISESKELEYPPIIMLPYWGKYYPSERKLKYIKTRLDARKQKEDTGLSEAT
jgi:hypothetical protein